VRGVFGISALPSSAEVKNAWRHTSTPQHAIMVWFLIKQYTSSWHSALLSNIHLHCVVLN